MRTLGGLVLPFFMVAANVGGCGCPGNPPTTPGDAGMDADVQQPDVAPDVPAPTRIGELCPTGSECAVGLLCLDDTLNPGLPAGGYCTAMCTADAMCGWDSFCSPPTPGGGPRFCLQRCPADPADCTGAPARVCSQFVLGLDLGQRACVWGNAAAQDGSPCTLPEDCNGGQVCMNNPFSVPGGMCITFGCTVGDNTTCVGPDGTCFDTGGVAICLDTCTMASDCRMAEGYACVPFPTGDDVCFYPAARPGAACAMDGQCGPAGSPWRCLTGASFPGGYCSGAVGTCTSDPSTCPMDGVCFDAGTAGDVTDDYCAATCGADTDCRMLDGYTCQPLGPMSQSVCVL